MLDTIDSTLNSSRRRHIAGGLLLSVAFLFAGLAITVVTIKDDFALDYEDEVEEYD